MNDFKGLRDPHLNIFWQYSGKPHLENNITKALINTLDGLTDQDFRIAFSSIFRLDLAPGKIKREFFLQKKPDLEKVEEFDKDKRIMFAFSPEGKCWGFSGQDIKNEALLFAAIKNELKQQYQDEAKLDEETKKAVEEYLEAERRGSIPDAWIFVYIDGLPQYVVALENKLYLLDPNQLNNHIEKSLLVTESKNPVIYRKYVDIIKSLSNIDCYLTNQFIEYLTILGYWELKDFSLACSADNSADNNIRVRLAFAFGKEILSKLKVEGGGMDFRKWNMPRRHVNYDYLKEINLLFQDEYIKLSLAFGSTMSSGRTMLNRLVSFCVPDDHLLLCKQSFHLLYQRGKNIGSSYIDCSYSVNDFITYLKKNMSIMKISSPSEAIEFYRKLLDDKIITQENFSALSSKLSGKKNPVLVVPEIYVEYGWTYEELSNIGFDQFVFDLNEIIHKVLVSTKQI